jgi:hypothetical protein
MSWHVRLSRRVNGWLGHDPGTMLCARLYREDAKACRYFDALFLVLRGEVNHCAAIAAWEDDPERQPERARRAGL